MTEKTLVERLRERADYWYVVDSFAACRGDIELLDEAAERIEELERYKATVERYGTYPKPSIEGGSTAFTEQIVPDISKIDPEVLEILKRSMLAEDS